MSKTFFKRLAKEIQLYEKDNFVLPNLILKPSDDIALWYFIIYDLKDTDFDDGIYLGKVMLPTNYPMGPPDFQMLTPSGRFEIGKKLCTSFSGYHKDLYSPSLNLGGMLCGLISFMTDDPKNANSRGIGGIYDMSSIEKKKIAKNSHKYNLTNTFNKDVFEKYFKEYYDILKFNIEEKKEEPKIEEPKIEEKVPVKVKRTYKPRVKK